MKKHLLKATAILFVASVLSTQNATAQSGSGSIIQGGLTDANALMGAYAGPLLKSFGAGLNGGWFNTAKPHGIGGFDFTVASNITFAPTADQSFDVAGLGMKNIRLQPGEKATSPTVFGDGNPGPLVGLYGKSPITGQDTLQSKFNLPQGAGVNIFAVPTAQLNVGVGYGTEVAIRFVPDLSFGSANVGMWGVAVKHDFKQWIPAIKEMPFDLSAMFGYTSVSASFKTDPLKADASSNTVYDPNPGKTYNNQKMEFASSGWTANVLISKKLLFFTPYLGLGYQYASTTLKMAGDYPITDFNPNYNPAIGYGTPGYDANNPNSHPKIVSTFHDPVTISGVISGARATLGFRLKLAVLTIHADYTFAEYSVASVGVGLNIQSIKPFKL